MSELTMPESSTDPTRMCKVCYLKVSTQQFISFKRCGHSFCRECVKQVFEMNIAASKTNIQCLRCSAQVSPYEVWSVVGHELFQKYLDFSLRRYLACLPNVRYCPAPDCTYAYILEKVSRCEEKYFVCARDDCGKEFCYECKRPWHPMKTCEESQAEIAVNIPEDAIPPEALNRMNAKTCPVCRATIEKMADGSCNQVHCVCCGEDFCWLCGKKVTEMHYLSPTGCPLYGRHQWSKKKVWCCRVGLWLCAPFLILLIALLAFPVIIILIPAGIGYKVYTHCQKSKKACRVFWVALAVLVSLLFSPFIALLGSFVFIPLAYIYVYGIIPAHLLWTSVH